MKDKPEVVKSEIILSNIRVLAIDQAVEEKNGQKVVVGKTATLELKPEQAEVLARSRKAGDLSLSLRSLLDAQAAVEVPKPAGNVITVYRGTADPEAYICAPICKPR